MPKEGNRDRFTWNPKFQRNLDPDPSHGWRTFRVTLVDIGNRIFLRTKWKFCFRRFLSVTTK